MGTLGKSILKWFAPMFLAGCGMFLQNWQLRIATYNYVHVMKQFEVPSYNADGLRNKDPDTKYIPLTVGKSINASFPGFGVLDDPLAKLLSPEPEDVHIGMLDMMAASFPFLFVCLAVGQGQLGTWTRIFVCFFFLAVGKGFFGWITIMPASDGWEQCQLRLNSDTKGFDATWYAGEHSVWEMLANTLTDPGGRLCADMMWSGHTYFVTIFALGIYELAGNLVRADDHRCGPCTGKMMRRIIQNTVMIVCVGQQAFEIYFVLKSRFHYSGDIIMAVLMTFLLYTNSFIAIMSKDWVNLWTMEENIQKPDNLYDAMNSNGDLFVPGCCCPCVYKPHGNQHIYHSDDIQAILDLALRGDRQKMQLNQDDVRNLQRMMRMPSTVFEEP